MALSDLFSNVHLLLRWIHVFAGIVWIGHLYFFNFVNIPFQGTIAADVKKTVNPQLMARALWWFRWGAMVTFVAGLLLFTQLYMYGAGDGFGPSELFMGADGITGRAIWILMGMVFGTIMWFNVWFIIWPNQQRALGIVDADADSKAASARTAMLFSRTNTLLSIPMLFAMVAAQNLYSVS